ncbi:MAG TPA: hypothetical protein VK456_00320 [Xanthobacteraceae bacterium]|nr:hypothetical protein [Xanthobacteraceae bacterium]
MARESPLPSQIRDWVQACFIVIGVLAGIWQFIFKEMLVPAAAPINVTTEVAVKEAGFGGANKDDKDQFEAIELTIAAKNPSTRDIYLLPSCWFAQGIAILTHKDNKDWMDRMTTRINKRNATNESMYFTLDKVPVVAVRGAFLEDQILHPSETISASYVFYVPREVYDLLYVHVQLPTAAVADAAEVEWAVTEDWPCDMHVFRKQNGVRGAEIRDFIDAFHDRNLQFQSANSVRELSLWQNSRSSMATTEPTKALTGDKTRPEIGNKLNPR